VYARFTDGARLAMILAHQEARRFERESVDDEHILLGLIDQPDCLAARILVNHGVAIEGLRLGVQGVAPRGPEAVAADRRPPPRGRIVLEFAIEEARGLGHNFVDTGHLLLGLLRDPDGLAGHILPSHGLTLEGARQDVRAAFEGGEGP
jgi:ATP-dependent Clp protease ATP-binding subunit ClpC